MGHRRDGLPLRALLSDTAHEPVTSSALPRSATAGKAMMSVCASATCIADSIQGLRSACRPFFPVRRIQLLSPDILQPSFLISGLSYKTTFNKELLISSFPLYSIKPSLRNLFMKKLTRDRVVPIISASVS